MNVSLTLKIEDIMGTNDVREEDEDLILTHQGNGKRMKKTEDSDVPTTDLEVIMEEAGSSSDSLSHRINTSLDQRIGFESAKPCCTKSMSENSVVFEEGISTEVVENNSLDKASDCCLNNNGDNVLIDKSNRITTENHDAIVLWSEENPHSTENDVKLDADSAETHAGETLRSASDNACNIHNNVSIVNKSACDANNHSEYECEVTVEDFDKFPGELSGDVLGKDINPDPDEQSVACDVDPSSSQLDDLKGVASQVVNENIDKVFSGDVLGKDINPNPVKQSVASDVDPSSSELDSLKRVPSQVVDDSVNKFPGEFSGDVRGKDISPNLDDQSVASDADASSSQLDELDGFASQIVNEIIDEVVQRAFPGYTGKKLLVLDVNGLLLDISSYVPYDYDPDEIILRKAVFKRPYCDDFLKFCFERFNVGFWSSKTKRNMEPILDFLLGNDKHKLLFCWDQSHCTFTGFSTVGKKRKPLLLKKLKKLWDKFEPDLPWEKGVYNESNTLLIDDSPHKALCNPRYTAIFPYTFNFRHVTDNSLGPEGDLRVYLEGLAGAENVQEYVKQNPFGQRAITETNLSWGYYLKVIEASSSPAPPVDDEP